MKTVETTGKTVEIAIEAGLKELGVAQERVDVEIISQGGLFSRPKVRLTVKETEGSKALAFIEGLMDKLKATTVAELSEDADHAQINIIGADLGFLIGYRGEVLDALQYLASLVANKDKDTFKRIVVDGEGYREKRTAALEDLALKLAAKAVRLKQSVAVEPMNPFERRVMHSKLQDNPEVTTHSEGEEPNRYIVITPKGVSPTAPRAYTRNDNRGRDGGGGQGGADRAGTGRSPYSGANQNRGRDNGFGGNNRGGFGGGGNRNNNRGRDTGFGGNNRGRNDNKRGGGSGFNNERDISQIGKSGFSDIGVGTKTLDDAPKGNSSSPAGGSGNRFAFRSSNKRPSPYSVLSGFEDNAGLKKSKFDKE